jgi:microcystin-dependent protein
MLVTNTTNEDYWFGPLHLAGGIGQTLTVDDTSATSLYLTDDVVADAINNLYNTGKITVSGEAQPFPRPTGVPQLLHGDGTPEGRVFAPQGSAYMRRDNTGASSSLYVKTTGTTVSTGWLPLSTATIAVPTGVIHQWPIGTAPTDWLVCDGSAVSRTLYSALFSVIGTTYGAGDGSSTYNVPDLRGRVPVGYAASGGHIDVSALGNSDAVALAHRRPKHKHTVNDAGHSHAQNSSTLYETGGSSPNPSGGFINIATASASTQSAFTGVTVGVDVANDPSDAPAYIVVNYIIKT